MPVKGNLNRRDFLRGVAVGTGMLAVSGPEILARIKEAGRSLEGAGPQEAAANEDFWFEVQQAFTVDRNLVNLNNGTVQNYLRIVQDAVRRHNEFTGNAAWHSMAVLNNEIESCRRRLAGHLGCDPEELVICRGGSEAGEIPIMGLELKAGDEIVTTNQDYPRLIGSWKQRVLREGLVLKQVPLPAPPVPLDLFYDMIAAAVTPKTKVILICHMNHYTAQMAPIKRITDMAHARGIKVIVDGAHGFMHVPFKLADFGCDFYTASLHKWLMAPPGNGFVRIPKDMISKVWPLTPPWTDTPNDIRRFEDVGTRTPSNRVAIAEALTFNEGIGLERKSARLRYLKERWANRLRALPRVRFYSSLDPAESCAIATFGVEGIETNKLSAHLLDKWGIIVSTISHPDRLIDGIRIVVNVSNTVREIDYFADVMEGIIKKGALV